MFKNGHISVKTKVHSTISPVTLVYHYTGLYAHCRYVFRRSVPKMDSLDTGQLLLTHSCEYDREIWGFIKAGDSLISWGSEAFWKRPCSAELGSYYKAAERVKMFIIVTYLNSVNCIFIQCHRTVLPCRDAIVTSSEQNCVSMGCLS
jgi:hypothetical protein